jgi:hypothetical protein
MSNLSKSKAFLEHYQAFLWVMQAANSFMESNEAVMWGLQ